MDAVRADCPGSNERGVFDLAVASVPGFVAYRRCPACRVIVWADAGGLVMAHPPRPVESEGRR